MAADILEADSLRLYWGCRCVTDCTRIQIGMLGDGWTISHNMSTHSTTWVERSPAVRGRHLKP